MFTQLANQLEVEDVLQILTTLYGFFCFSIFGEIVIFPVFHCSGFVILRAFIFLGLEVKHMFFLVKSLVGRFGNLGVFQFFHFFTFSIFIFFHFKGIERRQWALHRGNRLSTG